MEAKDEKDIPIYLSDGDQGMRSKFHHFSLQIVQRVSELLIEKPFGTHGWNDYDTHSYLYCIDGRNRETWVLRQTLWHGSSSRSRDLS